MMTVQSKNRVSATANPLGKKCLRAQKFGGLWRRPADPMDSARFPSNDLSESVRSFANALG
jgi:hypothetical protein